MTAAKFIQLTTHATGTNFTAFPDTPGNVVTVVNHTGTSLTFQHVADADEGEFVLPNGMAYAFRGLSNANQLRVKRTDESNTPVTLESVEVEL
ncbi:MAG: hypothetical protein ACO1TE_06425 [Prosthecobacter sp.]